MFEYNSPLRGESVFNSPTSSKEIVLVTEIVVPETVVKGFDCVLKVTKLNDKKAALKDYVNRVKWGYKIGTGKMISISAKGRISTSGLEMEYVWKVPNMETERIRVYAWLVQASDDVSGEVKIIGFPFWFDRYRKKGLNANMSAIADDMCYGDGVNKTKHFKYTKEEIEKLGDLMDLQLRVTETSLFFDFKFMATSLFATGDLDDVIQLMIKRFKENKGGEFEDSRLTKAVFAHKATKSFITNIENEMKERLFVSKGDVSKLFFSESQPRTNDANPNYGHPRFNEFFGDTLLAGLTICMNDTWAWEIIIDSIQLQSAKKYTINYRMIVYDHFGLDKPDMEKQAYFKLAGFRSWFVLQHIYSHQPFISRATKKFKLNGSFDVGKPKKK